MLFPDPHPDSSPSRTRCLAQVLAGGPGARQARLRETLTGRDPGCLDTLRQEALFPWLYTLWRQEAGNLALPAALLDTLRHDYFCALQQVVKHDAEAALVLEGLADAGVEAVLLKGADLRLRVYEDPAARPMTDLDLLVHPRNLAPARAVLASRHYRVIAAHTRQHPGFREDFAPADIYDPPLDLTLKVDLHWGLWNEFSVYGLPLSPILAQARPASFQGLPVKLLTPEHLLMHLCLHAYWDGVMLRQLVDIILTASRLPVDWDRFQADTSRWGLQVPLHQVLSLARQAAPAAVPALVLSGLAGRRAPLIEKLIKHGCLGPLTYYLASLSRQPLGQWPAFLAAKLWPDREYLVSKFGSASRLRYLRQFIRKFQKDR